MCASGSASITSAKVKADYASVTDQSGFKAGDGGFQVGVGGRTSLKGGAITSSDAAVQSGANRFASAGGTTLEDIQNRDDYKAKGLSLSEGYGKSEGSGNNPGNLQNYAGGTTGGGAFGYGYAKGSQSSTTASAISGIAGDSQARTGDQRSGALAKTWDGPQLEREVQAQKQITATFGQQATKKWGEFANGQQAAAQAAHDPQGETCWAETGACRVAGHALLGGLTGGAGGALGAGVSAASVETVAGAADKIGLTGAARDLFIAGVNTSVGAAVGGAAGAAGAHNEVVNNYLSSQQWRDFAKDLDQCQKSGGDCTSVVNRYRNISNDQDAQLASACRDLNSPGCRSMVAEVVGGRDAQIGLAIDGKLPANFIGRADLQGNGNLYERKVQAQDIVNACAADPTGCDQQRLRGSAQLLLTGVSIGALAVAAPGMAVEAGALVAEGATLYCARRPDSCVALAETLGSTLGGVPQSGVGGSSIASRDARGGAPAAGIAGAGSKGEVPEVVAGAGTTGRGTAAAGSEAAIPTGRGAVPAPEPEVSKPNNLAFGETGPVGRNSDAANDPVYGQGTATSGGTANPATVPGLKDQLNNQNLATIAAKDPRLAAAVKGSGEGNPNFSVGQGTAFEADQLGRIWVGDGAKKTSDGVGFVSADGTRIYRPPASKPNTPVQFNPTGVQANFVNQTINPITGKATIVSNGHLVINP